MGFFIVINFFDEALVFGLEFWEEEAFKFSKLFLVVIGRDNVKNQSDLLRLVLVSLQFLLNLCSLLLQLYLFLIVLSHPMTLVLFSPWISPSLSLSISPCSSFLKPAFISILITFLHFLVRFRLSLEQFHIQTIT
jgi:hypothetical protein